MISKCIAVVILARMAHGYPTGAPKGACESMKPNHGISGQIGPTPFTITLSAPSFECNEDITVTLGGSTPFKGFFCQARPHADMYTTSGNLTASGSVSMKNPCGTNAALTHKENGEKNTAVFKWTPPPTGKTNVYIVCTIVQERIMYWQGVTSTVLFYDNKCSGASHMTGTLLPTILCLLLCIISAFRRN